VASEFIALSLLVGIVKILIFITVDIFKHCQKNKKIKRADQILPEVYGTTLSHLFFPFPWFQLVILALFPGSSQSFLLFPWFKSLILPFSLV